MSNLRLYLVRKKIAFFTRFSIIVVLLGVIAYSLYQILDTNNNYVKEQRIREQMAKYKPQLTNISDNDINTENNNTVLLNQNIADAKKLNPDIVGWITLDNTRIDYPFVKAADNDFYLHRDINKAESYAGTIFMDYNCDSSFNNFSTIIYGHNMKNGTMFSDIRRYDNAEFFETNKTGTLFLLNATYTIEVFAYMLISSDNNIIYGTQHSNNSDKQTLLTYIAENSLRYRNMPLNEIDKLLILSTCTYNFEKARSVIIARLVDNYSSISKKTGQFGELFPLN